MPSMNPPRPTPMMKAGALGGDSAVSLSGAWTDTTPLAYPPPCLRIARVCGSGYRPWPDGHEVLRTDFRGSRRCRALSAVRVVSWNVARRVSRLPEQAGAIAERAPDALALQEVTARTLPLWRQACAALGLPHVIASLDGADPAREPAARRRTGVLLAARCALEPVSLLSPPWPETAAGAAPRDGPRAPRTPLCSCAERRQRLDQGRNARVDPGRACGRRARAAHRVRRSQHASP